MENWKSISIKEKMQIINGTSLVFAAIILYFVAFIMTLTVGLEVVSAGATLLATGLAFFGVSSYLKNQLISFENKMERQFRDYEDRNRIAEDKDDEKGQDSE